MNKNLQKELKSTRDELRDKSSELSDTAKSSLNLFLKSSKLYKEYLDSSNDDEKNIQNAFLTSYNSFMVITCQMQLYSQQILDLDLQLLNTEIEELNNSITSFTKASLVSSKRQRKLTRAIIFIGSISLMGSIITLLRTFKII